MKHYFGFRQILLKTTEGIVHQPGKAVLCGPYDAFADAAAARLRAAAWDARLSPVFEAESDAHAETQIEANTPSKPL